jgi:ribitol 2-dehydrogenase/3-dehydrosphinganine reductase
VSCIFPGNFQSEGFEEEQKTKPEITKTIEGPSNPIPGSECADIVLDQLAKGYDTVTTDFVGWVLGCSVLGVLPRNWSLFQIIVSFVFLVVSPIATWSIYRDVVKYFKTRSVDEAKTHEE